MAWAGGELLVTGEVRGEVRIVVRRRRRRHRGEPKGISRWEISQVATIVDGGARSCRNPHARELYEPLQGSLSHACTANRRALGLLIIVIPRATFHLHKAK